MRFLALCDCAHRNISIGDHANEPMVLAHRQDASGAGGILIEPFAVRGVVGLEGVAGTSCHCAGGHAAARFRVFPRLQLPKDWEVVMPWVGRTNFSTFGVGTSLRLDLEEIPTIPGRSPSPVRAGSKIEIEMAPGVRTKATIVSVADNEIQIELPDGTVWEMTHRTPFDPPIEIKSPGLNQQDWVVRSARPFTPSHP